MTQQDITEFLAAAARFIASSDTPPENWRSIQLWERKSKEGFFTDEIRVYIDGKPIGDGKRVLLPNKKKKKPA